MEHVKRFLRKRQGLCRFIRGFLWWASAFGVDMRKTVSGIMELPGAFGDYLAVRRQNRKSGARWTIRFDRPCLHNKHSESGGAVGHYFHQDLLVARRIFAREPAKHVDVASRVDGFVAHVASFRSIEVLDIRPQTAKIPNVIFRQCDFMKPPPEFTGYCDSLSCLHALEHFGLGRYGDPVDIDGHLRGLENLHKMLRAGGTLYLSFPIGPQRIEFNAHRIFAVSSVMEWFQGRFEVLEFSYVDDAEDLHENVPVDSPEACSNFGVEYGCGIFELRKI